MTVTNRLWAIQNDSRWARWAPEFRRWDLYSEQRKNIAADPTNGSSCYFVNPDGSVHWRNVDRNENLDYPGINARQISIGGSGRLWAIMENGIWARWAPEHRRWDVFSEERFYIAADPTTQSACYFVNPDYSVHWRDVDRNIDRSFPGISAREISVGGDNRLWAIDKNGVWARWAPEYQRWDVFSEQRKNIAASLNSPSACFFVNPDGSVHWRNVDRNENQDFPGISALQCSVGGAS